MATRTSHWLAKSRERLSTVTKEGAFGVVEGETARSFQNIGGFVPGGRTDRAPGELIDGADREGERFFSGAKGHAVLARFRVAGAVG